MTHDDLIFFDAEDEAFNELCRGHGAGYEIPVPWLGHSRVKVRGYGVLARRHDFDFVQPLAICAPPENLQRLYGRFSALRNEFSPLTAWCHVLEPRLLESLDGTARVPVRSGYEASWAGLAIAEAALLTERDAGSLRVASCFATATYAVARTIAIWPQIELGQILHQYLICNKLVRGTAAPNKFLERLNPIWTALIEAGNNALPSDSITQIIGEMRRNSERNDAFNQNASAATLSWPDEFRHLHRIDAFTPEERLLIFDQIVHELPGCRADRRPLLLFVAGYIATIAAGGLPSLTLAEQISKDWPEVLAWAYVIGGIGQKIIWASGFSDLGRLICRDISRPFHIDEPPTCDFGLDEALVLSDSLLSDPLANLKIKQQRLVLAAIYPGVNISIPLREAQEKRKTVTAKGKAESAQDLEFLADGLWPLIQRRLSLEGYARQTDFPKQSPTRKKLAPKRIPYK